MQSKALNDVSACRLGQVKIVINQYTANSYLSGFVSAYTVDLK
jgi:hypothetical protein